MPFQSRRLRIVCSAALACFACLVFKTVAAHPHVWITYGAQIALAKHKVTGLREDWTFTKGFPAMLSIDLSHYGADAVLDDADRDTFKKSAFDSLARVGYFTRVFVDGKPLAVGQPSNFSVALHGGKIVYTFVLPLIEPVELPKSGFQVGVWDENFFCDFEMRPDGVQLDPASSDCHISDAPDRDHPVFFGSVFPSAARVSC